MSYSVEFDPPALAASTRCRTPRTVALAEAFALLEIAPCSGRPVNRERTPDLPRACGAIRHTVPVLHLLIDTSVWLDLAKRRDGQRLIHALGQVAMDGDVELLVPELVVDEFERNRARIEQSMTTSVADRFKLLQKDLEDLGAEWHRPGFEAINALASEMPLVGAMATRNFKDIIALLNDGRTLEPDDDVRGHVVERGLAKQAPFRRHKNSVADAVLIELYRTASHGNDDETYCFVTSNCDDFSVEKGDRRLPHPDIADMFDGTRSKYFYGIDGLQSALVDFYRPDEFGEILDMSDFQENPRTLAEILEAEQEFFDRVWYERSVLHTTRHEQGESSDTPEQYRVSKDAQARVLARRTCGCVTATSSGACGTASCPPSDGSSVASGTSSIPDTVSRCSCGRRPREACPAHACKWTTVRRPIGTASPTSVDRGRGANRGANDGLLLLVERRR